MKIIYVGRFNQPNNDDEGAIVHGLTELGHKVIPVEERKAKYKCDRFEADFILCNHWHDFTGMSRFKQPKVLWCFDLMFWPNDKSLRARNQRRTRWAVMLPKYVDLCFFTDGDWVSKDKSGRLFQLMQGADQRILGYGQKSEGHPDILFAGTTRTCGYGRCRFVREMRDRWRTQFRQVTGTFRKCLANAIASSKVVIAPDTPVTNRYWSNRVYITCGFGGVMVHPYCEELAKQYEDGKEIVFYRDWTECHEKIEMLLEDRALRRRIREGALERTRREHTYKHRCQKLIEVVQEHLK